MTATKERGFGDELRAQKRSNKRVHWYILLMIAGLISLMWLIYKYQNTQFAVTQQLQQTVMQVIPKASTVGLSSISTSEQNAIITFERIDPALWQKITQTVAPQTVSNSYVTNLTNYTTNNTFALQGLYITPTDSPGLADISGSFFQGFEVNADGVSLGSDTVGSYIEAIVTGDGLSGGTSGEAVVPTLTVAAGNGITVDGDGVSVHLHSTGGLTLTGGGLSLLDSCSDGQLLKWSGSGTSWACASDASGAGALTVRETDGSPSVNPTALLEFGPATGSSTEFVVSDQGGGTARIRTGTAVPLTTSAATIAGAWIFSSEVTANGGLSCSGCVALGAETSGTYLAGLLAGSGLNVVGSGSAGATPTVSLDSSLAMFKTIDASLGSDPVADNLTDTLSLLSGNGVSVTGDASTDSISLDANLTASGGLAFVSGGVSLLNTCSDGQLLKWNAGSSTWACFNDNDTVATALTVRETDGSPSVNPTSVVEFGPGSGSSAEFIITDQGSGISRVRTGSAVPLSNTSATIAGAWTFSSEIAANGGLACTDCVVLGSETSGNYLAGLSAGSGLSVAGSGSEGATPTVALDSSLAMFKTIDASLGTDPVADSLTDSLSLSSGNGVNVTGDATTDSISFSANLTSNGGLLIASGGISLLNTCSNTQYLSWNSSGSSWQCASVAAAPNIFQSIAGDSGTASADSSSDSITLIGGNGLTTTGADTPDTVTFNVDLASGSGLTFSGGGLSLLTCSDGQALKRVSGAWACSTGLPTTAYQQHLAGSDNVSIGSSLTPLLTNGSGTAQSLPITITSGNKVGFVATVELSSSVATGPATYVVIRDDNSDNDCVTGGGDGTQIGGQVTSFLASIAQSFTTTFSFADTSPGTTTPRYQLCASTTIGLGTTTATDRSLKLEESTF